MIGYLFKVFSFPKSIFKEYWTIQVLTTPLKRALLKIYWKLINKKNFAKIYFQYIFSMISERQLLKEFPKITVFSFRTPFPDFNSVIVKTHFLNL